MVLSLLLSSARVVYGKTNWQHGGQLKSEIGARRCNVVSIRHTLTFLCCQDVLPINVQMSMYIDMNKVN